MIPSLPLPFTLRLLQLIYTLTTHWRAYVHRSGTMDAVWPPSVPHTVRRFRCRLPTGAIVLCLCSLLLSCSLPTTVRQRLCCMSPVTDLCIQPTSTHPVATIFTQCSSLAKTSCQLGLDWFTEPKRLLTVFRVPSSPVPKNTVRHQWCSAGLTTEGPDPWHWIMTAVWLNN